MVSFPGKQRVSVGDVAGIAELARPLVEPWYSGYICVFNPSDNTGGIDIDAGTIDYSIHPYWAGAARIQNIRTNLFSKQPTNDTTTRTVQFQIGYAKDSVIPDIHSGHQVVVIDGGNNHLLTTYQYVITGMINSSMAFNYTIIAEVNLESRANYVIGEPIGCVDLGPWCSNV